MFQKFFQRYTGFLRSLKAAYVVNNWLHADRLKHNISLYKKYGLNKSIFAPIGKKDFDRVGHSADIPWLDRPDALEQLEQHPDFQTFTPEVQAQMRQFVTDGYMILKGFVPLETVEALNTEVADQLGSGKVGFNFTGRKIFNFHEKSRLAREQFFRHPEMLRILSFLLGRKVLPFQSLNFILGSEQRPHSDLIHMTTEPQGYLIATWFALEPCTPENGALEYYPGSHRLPFVSTEDYESGNTALMIGNDSNKHYEDKIAAVIAENRLKPAFFYADTGDVLIWHGNLLHGGTKITSKDPNTTRKSMVCHYYAEDVICYHEMSQRPALMTSDE